MTGRENAAPVESIFSVRPPAIRSPSPTPAELRVMKSLSEGMSVRAIAKLNSTTEATVRAQIENIKTKTGARSHREIGQLYHRATVQTNKVQST